jgi:UDP-N-acetylmuramoyl-L-alanyl-D-glutamate--2,6-diaminopimelate ligase
MRMQKSASDRGRPLGDLMSAVHGAAAPLDARLATLHIREITNHSAEVEQDSLFVAVPGHAHDGSEYVAQAVERGAVAIMAETAIDAPEHVPVILVPDARRALADLAADWHGHPADRLSLIGITGTVGKTSVLSMLDAIMLRAGRPIGTIGSLGIGLGGELQSTGHTAPDALILHRALAEMADAGLRAAAMEVTSHALVQRRVEGLRFDLGVLLNLVPFEHVDYHKTFRGYIDAKSRYFEHLSPGAPLIFNHDDRVVRGVVGGRDLRLVPCGFSRHAVVRIENVQSDHSGMQLELNVRRRVEGLHGHVAEPGRLPLDVRVLGRSNATNAALAATAALCLGADVEAVHDALRDLDAPRRRMELMRIGGILVLDDTVGHPDSLSMVFEVVSALDARRLHVAFGIRGSRGSRINRRLGEALAVWSESMSIATLAVTACEDAADERNRVTPAERAAFTSALESAGTRFELYDTCAEAVARMMSRARSGDLVLLLGAQGMDSAAGLARQSALRSSV